MQKVNGWLLLDLSFTSGMLSGAHVSAVEGNKLKFTHVLVPGNTAQQNQCHDFKTEGGKLGLFFSCT